MVQLLYKLINGLYNKSSINQAITKVNLTIFNK